LAIKSMDDLHQGFPSPIHTAYQSFQHELECHAQ
jgi:hypothetical protein